MNSVDIKEILFEDLVGRKPFDNKYNKCFCNSCNKKIYIDQPFYFIGKDKYKVCNNCFDEMIDWLSE